MENNLIAWGMRLLGLGKLWDWLDGKKTYLQAAAEMLTGAGGMAIAAADELLRFMNTVHSLGDAVAFVRALLEKPDAPIVAFTFAWAGFLHGWGILAKKHADDKKHDELLNGPTEAKAAPQEPPAS